MWLFFLCPLPQAAVLSDQISGNFDLPEGTLDAMMQAVVCPVGVMDTVAFASHFWVLLRWEFPQRI